MAEHISHTICRDCGSTAGMDWTAHWQKGHNNVSAKTRCHPCYLKYLRDRYKRKKANGGVLVRERGPDNSIRGSREDIVSTCRKCGVEVTDRRTRVFCSKQCMALTPEERKAKNRIKNHKRRAKTRRIDLVPSDEAEMRRRARFCPLCRCRLLNKPNDHRSKHLDHIVPICMGGTTTIGNLRIICFLCNVRRPKTGEDFYGQTTLWCTESDVLSEMAADLRERTAREVLARREAKLIQREREKAERIAARPARPPRTMSSIRYFDCCYCRRLACNTGKKNICRNLECQQRDRKERWKNSPPKGRVQSRLRAEQAFELREAGHDWSTIANALAYGAPNVASAAVTRWRQGVQARNAA